MHPILRTFLAIVFGLIIGVVSMMIAHLVLAYIVPLPEGVDFDKPTSFQEHIGDFTALHFFTASLAHGLGTLVAAFIAVKFSQHKSLAFLSIAIIFLLLGIQNAIDLNPPVWFTLVDLLLAYFPMAWIGMKLAGYNTWFPPKH